MICFKDMTFCSANCATKDCHRNWNDDLSAQARKWWGGDDAPVSFSDFSADCPDYVEKK